MSTILLFGTGQIGVFAARALSRDGIRVHAADAAPNAPYYMRYGPGDDAPDPVELDVTSASDVQGFIASHPDPLAVVFAAGYTGARATAEPDVAQEVAQRGITNVLAASTASGIRRAVVVSSLAVYGSVADGPFLTEDGPTEPGTTYGRIQLALERAARGYANRLDVAILRVAGVFGPARFGFGSHSSRFVERMLYASAIGEPVRIEGAWDDEDDLIYVKDVAQAMRVAAQAPGTGSFTVNVGLGRVSTVREIADAVRQVFPAADIDVTPPARADQTVKRPPLGCASLLERLGVRPAFPLSAAMRDYASEAGLIHVA